MMKHLNRYSVFYLLSHVFQVLKDDKSLGDCGFTSSNARAEAPAIIGMADRAESKQKVDEIYLFI